MHRQFHDLGKLLGLRSVCVHSGVAKDTQYAEPAVGCDVCVGTPGRLQQFVTARQLKLLPCMILVVDGADRMLSMGLEHELTQIAHKIRPDHQTVMWVTSWLKGPQRLVDYMLENYVQSVHVVKQTEKEHVLAKLLKDLLRDEVGRVVVNSKTREAVRKVALQLHSVSQIRKPSPIARKCCAKNAGTGCT
nr:probable ATP-dependent RNA helicase DDX17 [Rhipicephalus microplus]